MTRIEKPKMKWILYEFPDKKGAYMTASVCTSCLDGEHLSYGDDHRLGEENRRDCKNVENKSQCNCNPDWEDLYEVITSGPEQIYDCRDDAEKARAKLEEIANGGKE